MKLIDYIKQFWNGIPGWAKALVGGIGAGIAYLVATGAADIDATPVDLITGLLSQIGSFTTLQWVAFLGAIVGVDLLVYFTPNR